MGCDELCQGGEHGGRPAADDLRGPFASLQTACQQLGDEAVVAGRAVVGCQLDLDASPAEVVDACQERGGAHSVEQGHERRLVRPPSAAVNRTVTAVSSQCPRDPALRGLARAEPGTAQGQERRLADAAGDEDDRALPVAVRSRFPAAPIPRVVRPAALATGRRCRARRPDRRRRMPTACPMGRTPRRRGPAAGPARDRSLPRARDGSSRTGRGGSPGRYRRHPDASRNVSRAIATFSRMGIIR